MKHVFLLISLLFFTIACFSQKKKDTLFFSYDKNYTLFYKDYKKWIDKDYKSYEEEVLKNIFFTKTEGYFLFKIKDTLYNLKPKRIFSLKDYVEKREFYIDGIYNKKIEKSKIKNKIFNNYKVFIVRKNFFIEIRQNPYENFYNSFYPIKYQNTENYPKQTKDTIFIKYDNNLLKKYKEPIDNYNYYLIKDSGTCGTISFEEKQIYLDLRTNKIYCLKNIIKKAKAYHTKNKYKIGKIDDCNLANYLGKFTLFFVDENEFIKVQTRISEI